MHSLNEFDVPRYVKKNGKKYVGLEKTLFSLSLSNTHTHWAFVRAEKVKDFSYETEWVVKEHV